MVVQWLRVLTAPAEGSSLLTLQKCGHMVMTKLMEQPCHTLPLVVSHPLLKCLISFAGRIKGWLWDPSIFSGCVQCVYGYKWSLYANKWHHSSTRFLCIPCTCFLIACIGMAKQREARFCCYCSSSLPHLAFWASDTTIFQEVHLVCYQVGFSLSK